jgi:hypothetical protein
MTLTEMICDLTLPCADNGEEFTDVERIDRINKLLCQSHYFCLEKTPLAQVWGHRDFDPSLPMVLISSHIDSLYTRYHAGCSDGILCGTFDNSITNAIVIYLMLGNLLPTQTLVAFTGDEEYDSNGADQVMTVLSKLHTSPLHPQFVLVLDITEEAYDTHGFTFENLFCQTSKKPRVLLRFQKKREIKTLICGGFAPVDVFVIKNGEADESWQYNEYDLNCCSLCLPCKTLTGDMHDNQGVFVKQNSVIEYADALQKIVGILIG